ncbi:citrate lyase holo-[acyl-carrier protein] synthase [Aerococcaceae bacterium 50-4]
MSLEIYDEIFSGPEVNLYQMLDARDKRYALQQALLKEFPSQTLLVVTMNIPGNIKNSTIIMDTFERAIKQMKATLPTEKILHEQVIQADTGNEGFYVLDLPADDVKDMMIEIEEDAVQGRLYDLDVLKLDDQGKPSKLSREDGKQMPRKCFVCNRNAKACTRSRAHSDLEMKEAVARLIINNHGEE